MKSGIYAIWHLASGKVYVGSAVHINRRWQGHASRLAKGTHHSARLQKLWNKHGGVGFAWVVLEMVPEVTDLIQREQCWLDDLDATDKAAGLNMSPTAGSVLGSKYSARGLANLAAWRAANPVSQATRESLRARYLGVPRSAETKAKVSRSLTGKRLSPEAIEKRKATLRGRKRSAEWVEKIAAGNRGRTRSPEVRSKISATKRAKNGWRSWDDVYGYYRSKGLKHGSATYRANEWRERTTRFACSHCGNEVKNIMITHAPGAA